MDLKDALLSIAEAVVFRDEQTLLDVKDAIRTAFDDVPDNVIELSDEQE